MVAQPHPFVFGVHIMAQRDHLDERAAAASAAWFKFEVKRIPGHRVSSTQRRRDWHRGIALRKLEKLHKGDAIEFGHKEGFGKWYQWNKNKDPLHAGKRNIHPLHPKYMQGPPVNYDFVEVDGDTDEHDADVNYEDMVGG